YQLLGGACREKIRVYQGCGGATPEQMAENAVALIEQYRYTALKLSPHPPHSEGMPWNEVLEAAAARLGAVRAAVGDALDLGVDPNNPMGPVATAVNVHLAACIPNFLILEYHPDDRAPRRDFIQEPMHFENGYLTLPPAPGLGIELNEEAFEHYPFKPWRRAFP